MENSTSELHTKLQLVAEDVRYLKQQFTEAAKAKMDLYLPEMNEEDTVRKRVDELLQNFISETFELSRHAMIIDGEDMSDRELRHVLERDDDVEPFDLELNDKLRQLYAEVDEKTLEVTELRRTVPHQAIELQKKNHQQQTDSNSTAVVDYQEPDEPEINIDQVPQRTINDFSHTIKLLQQLKQTVPDEYVELDKLQQTIGHFT